MTEGEEKDFRDKCEKDFARMSAENNTKWCEISTYLDDEHNNGNAEFRLVVNDDKSFYIHPIDRDGQTLDGKL